MPGDKRVDRDFSTFLRQINVVRQGDHFFAAANGNWYIEPSDAERRQLG